MAQILRILKITGIGGRDEARESELEWGQKNDREGEDLLVSSGRENFKVVD